MLDAVFLGALGLIVGSFLNVLILRRGARALSGRSACLSCGTTIAWFDLVPVLSWVLLRGRCRACGAKISIQYPLVELATALLFLGAGLAPSALPLRALGLAIAAFLVAITAYDLRHTIIPDSWAYAFAALALAYGLVAAGPVDDTGTIAALLGGPAAALPLFALWGASRGAWMGFGDVKLALGIGWLLGPLWGFIAVFFAFVIGAIVSVPLLFFSSEMWKQALRFTPYRFFPLVKSGKGFTMKSEVPFGPFLIASCIVLWLLISYGIDPLAVLSARSL